MKFSWFLQLLRGLNTTTIIYNMKFSYDKKFEGDAKDTELCYQLVVMFANDVEAQLCMRNKDGTEIG